MKSEGLPRSWRLTRTSDMAAVWRSGRRRRTPRLDIFWRENEMGHPRLGVVVPRYRHTAVRRNRLRRWLREAARRRVLPELAPLDVVLRARAQAYDADFGELADDLERWARSLQA